MYYNERDIPILGRHTSDSFVEALTINSKKYEGETIVYRVMLMM